MSDDATAHKSDILPPGATIGILGGGQLGRMLASAAARLGLKSHIYAPELDAPAADVSGKFTKAAYTDEVALTAFVKSVDVVTYEFENIPVATAEIISSVGGILRPGVKPLEVAQDRLAEKQFIKKIGIGTAPYMPVASKDAMEMAMQVAGVPSILKTRRFGYDGKGQAVIHDESEAGEAYDSLEGAPAILEGFVPFEREISIIAARSVDGEAVFYDAPENVHRDGILSTSTVPAAIKNKTRAAAEDITKTLLDALDYVGVMAVEFFVLKDGALLVNEIAPRVHNSGHWTADACACGQFEQHIRAVCGWPLGNVTRHSDMIMENLIGDDAHNWENIAREKNAVLTLYGKREARDGRKMGHVTRLTPRK